MRYPLELRKTSKVWTEVPVSHSRRFLENAGELDAAAWTSGGSKKLKAPRIIKQTVADRRAKSIKSECVHSNIRRRFALLAWGQWKSPAHISGGAELRALAFPLSSEV